MTKNEPMVSRSLRIKKDTLKVLEKMAEDSSMGITVYIRFLLENYVTASQNLEKVQQMTLEEVSGE